MESPGIGARSVSSVRLAAIAAALLTASSVAQVGPLPGAWRAMPAAWQPPSARPTTGEVVLTYDSLRGECVLLRWNGTANAVFTWNGTVWQPAGTTPWWGPATGFVHDPVRDRCVALTATNNVWEWDRTTWHWRGASPFTTALAEALCWDGSQQVVMAISTAGLWQWNGAAWSFVPGSALPALSPYMVEWKLARDQVRNVLVATSHASPHTLEWNGSAWQWWLTASTERLHIVEAPSFGGIVGYRENNSDPDVSDTLRWNPVSHTWENTGAGGSPGVHGRLALAYDAQRARLVAFTTDPQPTWEYDPAHTWEPRTWIVGPNALLPEQAMQRVSPGDRVVVRAGWTAALVSGHEGIDVVCERGAVLAEVYFRLPAWQSLSLQGGTIHRAQIHGGDRIALRDTFVRCRFQVEGANLAIVERCQLGAGGAAPSLCMPFTFSNPTPLAVACACIVDDCSGAGFAGFTWGWPVIYEPPSPAVNNYGANQLWVVHSSLRGGDGHAQAAGAAGVPAIVANPGSGFVLGGSALSGGSSPVAPIAPPVSGNVAVTADTRWNGGTPPLGALPPRSWIETGATVALGQALTVAVTVQPGQVVFLMFAPALESAPVPGFAFPLLLELDELIPAATMVASASFTTVVPRIAALAGLRTYWQGAVLAGGLDVTNVRSVLLR